MAHDFADRNLLFGTLALQTNFIDRDALLAALQAWAAGPARSLGDLLREQGKISPEQQAALDTLVRARLGSLDMGGADDPSTVAHEPRPAAEGGSDRYRVLRPHARGGLGEVFVALDQQLHREVALKEIQKPLAADPASCARFVQEAEITGGLEHPGVVPVYGLGCYADGRPFYAMRFIQGETLRDAIQHFHQADKPGRDRGERNLALRQLLGHFVALCNTVAYAHSRGVLHRDLKPANVLLGKFGETLVVDWGLAKAVGRDETDPDSSQLTLRPPAAETVAETQLGSALGTPAYMSPEQAAGRLGRLRPASDVYSLGATLYTLLTGKPPVEARDTGDILQKVQKGDWPPPRQVKPETPAPLDAVCRKAMALKPEDRYGSALDLAADVEHWLADEPVSAWPDPWAVRARRWLGRHRPLVAGAAAAVLVALISLGVAAALLGDAGERERLAKVDALEKGEEVKKQSDTLRRELYVAEMNLAQRAWDQAALGRVNELLEKWKEADDLLGFEWNYLRRLAHSDRRTLRGHVGPVYTLTVTPDGEFLASAGSDGTVRVWEWRTGREFRVLRGHPQGALSVAFSPDGKYLASGGGRWDKVFAGELIIWDWRRGQQVRNLVGHRSMIQGLTYSPDGGTLAAGDYKLPGSKPATGVVRLWDVASGTERRVYNGHGGSVDPVSFSPDGRLLASSGDDGGIHLWDPSTGRTQLILKPEGRPRYLSAHCLAFSPDGRQIATGHINGALLLWDAASGRPLDALRGHEEMINAVRFSPDGNRLASCGVDGITHVWDVPGRRELLTIRGHDIATDVVFLAGGRKLASAGFEGTIRIWDVIAPAASMAFRGHTAAVYALAFSRDGRQLASSGLDKTLRLHDLASGKPLLSRSVPSIVYGLALSPDGKRLAVAGRDEEGRGLLKLFDAGSGAELCWLKGHAGNVRNVVFLAGGRQLLSAGAEGSVRLWDVADGRELRRLDLAPKIVRLAVSPDARLLAAAVGEDFQPGRVHVWELASGRELFNAEPHSDKITGIAFFPDGTRLITSSHDKTLRVLDAATGRQLAVLRGHTNWIRAVAMSPDGKRVASACDDRTVRLWDVATGREILVLQGSGGWAMSVAFSPDGSRVAAGDAAGGVQVWEASPLTAETLAAREPLFQVQFLFSQTLPRAEVLKQLQADNTLSEAIREQALALAKEFPQDIPALHEAARRVARRSGADAAAYRRALAQADEAVRAVPKNADYLGTLGAAHYRLGQFREAVDALVRADQLRTEQKGGIRPDELALLAMAWHRLGKQGEAAESLDRLRRWLRDHPADGEALPYLHEAEAVFRDDTPARSP
jgi:WD40 repeat protein